MQQQHKTIDEAEAAFDKAEAAFLPVEFEARSVSSPNIWRQPPDALLPHLSALRQTPFGLKCFCYRGRAARRYASVLKVETAACKDLARSPTSKWICKVAAASTQISDISPAKSNSCHRIPLRNPKVLNEKMKKASSIKKH